MAIPAGQSYLDSSARSFLSQMILSFVKVTKLHSPVFKPSLFLSATYSCLTGKAYCHESHFAVDWLKLAIH